MKQGGCIHLLILAAVIGVAVWAIWWGVHNLPPFNFG